MEQSRKRSPQSEFWNIREKGRRSGKKVVTHSTDDHTIRIWDAKAGRPVGTPLKGHGRGVLSVAYSPDGQNIVSGSKDNTIRVWNSVPPLSVPISSLHSQLYQPPDPDGWVRDSEGGFLYWVPQDCRVGLHSPALLTIPFTSHVRSVSLDFEDFVFGTSWAQIFKGAEV